MRWLLIVFISGIIFANDLKIIGAVPFGSSSLRLESNRALTNSDISIHKINEINFIDIYAVLLFGKKEYSFSNGASITLVQNNKQRARLLISLTSKTTYEYTINSKYLYIVIKDKLPPLEVKPQATIHKEVKSTKTIQSKTTQKAKEAQDTQPLKSYIAKDIKPSKANEIKKEISNNETIKKEERKDIKKPQAVLISKSTPKDNAKLSSYTRKKIIMIDPGHGGKDCGAIGVAGVCEKAVVLIVSLETAKILDKKGYIVYITRNKDYFIELRDRTEMANEKKADLFVSIHANSIPKGSNNSANGVETYFLSTARTERALFVAELENKGDIETMNYYSKSAFLNTLSSHRLILSNKLAIDLQSATLNSIRESYKDIKDGGVREGPFWVLAGALMPSALIEIGYQSNPKEANRLLDKDYQKLIANGIVNGIEAFFAKNPIY